MKKENYVILEQEREDKLAKQKEERRKFRESQIGYEEWKKRQRNK